MKLKKEADLRKSTEVSAQAAKDKILDLGEKVKSLVESRERDEKRHLRENYYVQDEACLSCQRVNAEVSWVTNLD